MILFQLHVANGRLTSIALFIATQNAPNIADPNITQAKTEYITEDGDQVLLGP